MQTSKRLMTSFYGMIIFFLIISSTGLANSEPKTIALSQTTLLQKVCEKNFEIIYQKYDLEFANEQVQKETAIFEPKFVATYNYKDSLTPNTAEQFFDRLYMDKFKERLKQYRLGMNGLLSTGTLYSVDYTIDDISNDLVDNKYRDNRNETSSYIGIQVTQPLLKNRGPQSTLAKIQIAQASKDISFQAYRQKVMDIVYTALNSYWELYYTIKQHAIYKDSVHIAKELLQTYTQMFEAGKVAESDLFEIQSALALRQSLLSAAQQKMIEAQNEIFKLLSVSRQSNAIHNIIVLDQPESYKTYKTITYNDALEKALVNNPRYLSSLKHLNKQTIHTQYTNNQSKPELNFKASFGINSLDNHPEEFLENIWNDSDETWSVGLEFILPLRGGIDSKTEYRMAQIREKQARLAIQSIKMELENQIDTSIQQVHNAVVQMERHVDNVKLKQKTMDIEMSRLEGGKSNIIDVFEKEKNLNQSRNELLRAIVNLELSVVALRRIEGTLLDRFGVNIEKPKESN